MHLPNFRVFKNPNLLNAATSLATKDSDHSSLLTRPRYVVNVLHPYKKDVSGLVRVLLPKTVTRKVSKTLNLPSMAAAAKNRRAAPTIV